MTQTEKTKLTEHTRSGERYRITQDQTGVWRLRDTQGRQIRKSPRHEIIAQALERQKKEL